MRYTKRCAFRTAMLLAWVAPVILLGVPALAFGAWLRAWRAAA
jgi:hypothetical protein